jgi:lipoprotein-releasing system ATP-binding protein
MQNIIIETEALTKSFDNLQVLKGIDLKVYEGEIVAIAGASGAGKTTLLQIIGTLDRADSGSVRIKGQELTAMNDTSLSLFRNQNIGFVFQFHQLLPEFTAIENVMLPALIGKLPFADAKNKASELLALMGLSDREGHKPGELSGGEKQRVAVARALINSPAVVLADEPTGSLDSENKAELHRLFFDLRKQMGQTFVIVTHDSELAQLTDRIFYMKDGKIVDA